MTLHAEADFVAGYQPQSVLDAGCGTGRVAIELARRGVAVVGVDLDPRLLGSARKQAPTLSWHLADLQAVRLRRRFDAVLLAGNVMIFLAPGTEAAVLQNCVRHLAWSGVLIAGFQLSVGYLALPTYDRLAGAAGLVLVARYADWDRAPWTPAAHYAVSVHRHRGGGVDQGVGPAPRWAL
ncbi:MAG TPA: class I SAM-dependent methyltransferase [Chloroflexia bacterium]|nr:class I SAM-dependent methyltransferase [Chloroflexia bacterium]